MAAPPVTHLHWAWDGKKLLVETNAAPAKAEFRNQDGQLLSTTVFTAETNGPGRTTTFAPTKAQETLRVDLISIEGNLIGQLLLPAKAVRPSAARGADGPEISEAVWETGHRTTPPLPKANIFSAFKKAGGEILAEQSRLPDALVNVERELGTPPVKDEFETTQAFRQRVEAYNRKVRRLNNARRRWKAKAPRDLSPSQRADLMAKMLAEHAPSPTATFLRYEADEEKVLLTLGPDWFIRDMGLPRTVQAKMEAEAAKKLKSIGRVGLSPKWTFKIDRTGALMVKSIELLWTGQPLALSPTDATMASSATGLPNLKIEKLADASTMPAEIPLLNVPEVIGESPELKQLQQDLANQDRQLKASRSETERQALLRNRQETEKRLQEMKDAEVGPDDLPARLAKAPASPQDPHRFMLAIGISSYKAVPAVPFASEAAQVVKTAGTRLLGIPEENSALLTDQDATQGSFKGKLKRVLKRLTAEDTLYFYYAGHGAPSRDGKSAYLMPQDADEATFEEEELRMENLLAQLAASKARRIVVMLDACFSGRTGPQAILFKGVAPVMVTPTTAVRDNERITLFTASEGNQFANELRERSQRLFTWHLVDALLDNVRDLAPLAKRVREGVSRASQARGDTYEQTPTIQGRREGDL